MDNWYIYIIDKQGKLYVGVTTDLENRMRQHGVEGPLHIEGPMPKTDALKRETTLKGWRRERKLALIIESGSSPQFPYPKSFDKNCSCLYHICRLQKNGVLLLNLVYWAVWFGGERPL